MGTRSWSSGSEVRYKIGDTVFVKADFFNSKAGEEKYSDYFTHKEERAQFYHSTKPLFVQNFSLAIQYPPSSMKKSRKLQMTIDI